LGRDLPLLQFAPNVGAKQKNPKKSSNIKVLFTASRRISADLAGIEPT